jgi:hypothetical protein
MDPLNVAGDAQRIMRVPVSIPRYSFVAAEPEARGEPKLRDGNGIGLPAPTAIRRSQATLWLRLQSPSDVVTKDEVGSLRSSYWPILRKRFHRVAEIAKAQLVLC